MLPYKCIQVLVANIILLYTIYLTALILLNVILMKEYQQLVLPQYEYEALKAEGKLTANRNRSVDNMTR